MEGRTGSEQGSAGEIAAPLQYVFQDDGSIPNSRLPVLIYKNAFTESGSEAASWLEKRFAANQWTNSWRDGVFTYHHYHSITHEVLGVFAGSALLHLGGEKGQKIEVSAGDVLVLPAGTGHKKLESTANFGVVGAYPGGRDYDILRGKPEDRPRALENIARVPLPENDPLLGQNRGLLKIWA